MSDIKEPILACPNDPDDVKTLSDVAKQKIDEVFIGSCMTNIGHFRAAAKLLNNKDNLDTELWVAPPTRMDESQLKKEGSYDVFNRLTEHTELPGCSLCMGNQARVAEGSTVVSTSTRNFPIDWVTVLTSILPQLKLQPFLQNLVIFQLWRNILRRCRKSNQMNQVSISI